MAFDKISRMHVISSWKDAISQDTMRTNFLDNIKVPEYGILTDKRIVEFEKEKLFVVEAFVNQGPILKRMRPTARGKAFKIEKKISHITIRVAEIKN